MRTFKKSLATISLIAAIAMAPVVGVGCGGSGKASQADAPKTLNDAPNGAAERARLQNMSPKERREAEEAQAAAAGGDQAAAPQGQQ